MKRCHDQDEGKDLDVEKEKRAKENDEARKQGRTYVEHGGKYDGSMKSSLFEHVMDVTEDMFKIPEDLPEDEESKKILVVSKVLSEMDMLLTNVDVCLNAAQRALPISVRKFIIPNPYYYKYQSPNAHMLGEITEKLSQMVLKLSTTMDHLGDLFIPSEYNIDVSSKKYATEKYRIQHCLDACRILSPVLHHYGSMVVPCFTHVNAEPLVGTTCLRYVSITNRKYNTELQKLKEKLEFLRKDREEREKLQQESEANQKDEAIEMTNEKPGSSISKIK